MWLCTYVCADVHVCVCGYMVRMCMCFLCSQFTPESSWSTGTEKLWDLHFEIRFGLFISCLNSYIKHVYGAHVPDNVAMFNESTNVVNL